MKNKGRRHKVKARLWAGTGNCKSTIWFVTRPIESMSSKGFATNKFEKKKWQKRIRGYLKTARGRKLFLSES